MVGIIVGTSVGSAVGAMVGIIVGTSVGSAVGAMVGIIVGTSVGSAVGITEGSVEGLKVGKGLGLSVSAKLGAMVGGEEEEEEEGEDCRLMNDWVRCMYSNSSFFDQINRNSQEQDATVSCRPSHYNNNYTIPRIAILMLT
eukprot:scaffold1446_cov175-Ochromonas_danica.AAC.26